jgi:hypothetical protein
MQMSVQGLSESAQHDVLGWCGTAQFGDERHPHASANERELGGEVGGFGDELGGETG